MLHLARTLACILHSANHVKTSPVPAVEATARGVAPVSQAVDGPTVPIPPVQPRYQGLRLDMQALNRNPQPLARRGSTRAAVGL